ncbi:MAG TPA: hypothetical protein VE888_09160 [Streptosporangiaceae bacterium]|nr:hypothetical protein [Streptosporangiaceae bacterium]
MRARGRPDLIPAGWYGPAGAPGRLAAVFSSPRREEAARARRSEHAIVTMRRRSLRVLQRMERDLASSDPGLDALFRSFARRTFGCDLRWVEEVGGKRFLLFGRRRERKLTERMKDWTAENRKDP